MQKYLWLDTKGKSHDFFLMRTELNFTRAEQIFSGASRITTMLSLFFPLTRGKSRAMSGWSRLASTYLFYFFLTLFELFVVYNIVIFGL